MSSLMEDTPIQLSRSRYIERDRSIAVLRLEQHYFYVGEPVLVRYYVEPDSATSEIDTLVAVGIREGLGKENFKIISMGGLNLISDVVESLPDVSQLVHGELYIYHNVKENTWSYVYKPEDSSDRKIEEINSPDTIFVSIKDRYKWYWRGGELKREDDFLSSSGMEGTIEEFFNLAQLPTIEASIKEGYLFKKGTTQTLNINIKVVNAIGNDITSFCKFTIDKNEIQLNKQGLVTISGINSDHDFNIVAEFKAGTKDAQIEKVLQVRFGNTFYYGEVAKDWKPNAANVKALEHKFLSSRQNFNWIGINLNKQKTVFAYPKVYGYLTHIYDDNGLCYLADYTISEVNIDGESYYIYLKNEEIQISKFDQKFIFAAEDTTDDIRFEKFGDIVRAWNNQNLANGLVVLGENGELPETLGSSSKNSGDYVEVKSFVTEYPKSGMTIGNVYFNSVTGKLFTATSATNGKIEEPKAGKMYLNLANKSLYIWKALEMVGVGGSIVSHQITDILDIL